MQHIDSQDDSCFENEVKTPQNALFSLLLVFALRGHCKIDPGQRKNATQKGGAFGLFMVVSSPLFFASLCEPMDALVGLIRLDQMPGVKQMRTGTIFSGNNAPAGLKNLNHGHGTCRILDPVSQLQQVALTPVHNSGGPEVGNIC